MAFIVLITWLVMKLYIKNYTINYYVRGGRGLCKVLNVRKRGEVTKIEQVQSRREGGNPSFGRFMIT